MIMFKLLTSCMRKFTIAALGCAVVVLALAAPAAAAPQNPNRGNFCSDSDVTTTAVYSNDPSAGVTISSLINIPSSGGIFGIYIRNNGTDDITVPPAPFSTVLSGPIPQATDTPVPTVPPGGGAVFNDGFFSLFNPPLHASQDVVGCVHISAGSGTVNLYLSLTRGSTTYSELIKVHYEQ
jgi:hypothetical protein